jgi:N-acetylmuramoyl-L-alanine amidase
MARILPVAIAFLLSLLAACSSTEPAGVASTKEPAAEAATSTPRPTGRSYAIPGVAFGESRPTPTPIPIYHPPPYSVAIEAGHGGPSWWGGSSYDAEGNRWIEKDLNLDMALRLDVLLREAGFNTLLIRDGDYTLLPFDSANYRPSFIAETQARVDVANAAEADIIVSLHFNGSGFTSIGGTETYYNPDRPFGNESYNLALFVHEAVLDALAEIEDFTVHDRGIRNDAEVGGDPENAHSYLLGTNDVFRPAQMPGIIAEPLFLSNAADLAAITDEDARQQIAEAVADGIEAYFAWLWPTATG